MNSNNPNQGGTGDSSISKNTPDGVSVSSPDQTPSAPALGGSEFLSGSPQGREAQPKPKVGAGNPLVA